MSNYYFDEAPFTTYGEFNPIPVFSTTNGGHTVKALQASNSIRFASSSSSIGINNYTSTAAGRTYVLFQDGTAIASLVIPATGGGSYADRTIATGLDTGSVHEYEIACVLPIQGSASNWYDSHLILDNLASVAHPTRAVLAFYGDSITGVTNAGGTVVDTRDADMWQACKAAGRAMTISGVAGGKVVNTGRDSTANINAAVDQVHVRYGVNDLPDLTGGTPNTTFQTAYSDMIDNIRTRIGAGKPIYCYKPWPVSSGSNRNTAGTLIQNAISGKSNVIYIDTDNWYPTSASYLPDGTHPNATAYALMANREIPIFSAVSISLTAPAQGTAGVASGNGTVTLLNGATFTGDQTITLTSSNSGDTITPSVGSPGTGAVTVTPSNGATSFTYTVTRATSGTSVITPTAAQGGWTMPAGVNYVVASVSGSPQRQTAIFAI